MKVVNRDYSAETKRELLMDHNLMTVLNSSTILTANQTQSSFDYAKIESVQERKEI